MAIAFLMMFQITFKIDLQAYIHYKPTLHFGVYLQLYFIAIIVEDVPEPENLEIAKQANFFFSFSWISIILHRNFTLFLGQQTNILGLFKNKLHNFSELKIVCGLSVSFFHITAVQLSKKR